MEGESFAGPNIIYLHRHQLVCLKLIHLYTGILPVMGIFFGLLKTLGCLKS